MFMIVLRNIKEYQKAIGFVGGGGCQISQAVHMEMSRYQTVMTTRENQEEKLSFWRSTYTELAWWTHLIPPCVSASSICSVHTEREPF